MVELVQPVGAQPGRKSVEIAVKALAAGVCVAAALVLMTSEQSSPTVLDSANVFEEGYHKPLEGHWVRGGPGGGLLWMNGKTFVKTYGVLQHCMSTIILLSPPHTHASLCRVGCWGYRNR